MEIAAVTPLLAGALVHVLIASGLFAWGRWVGRRHRGVWWRRSAWLPLVAVGLALVGIVWTSVYVVRAFGAVASADPAQKATLLAQNISNAMNCTAFFSLPSWGLYLASIVVFAVGSSLRPRGGRPSSG